MAIDIETVGLAISCIFVLCTLSFCLYKENVASRFALDTMIAMAIATQATTVIMYLGNVFIAFTKGSYWYIVPILFGVSVLFGIPMKYRYVSNHAIGLIAGVGSGLLIRSMVETNIVKQLAATILPVYGLTTAQSLFENVLYMAIVLITIYYFILTFLIKDTTSTGVLRKTGRLFLMVMFGATLGNIIMSRVAVIVACYRIVLNALGFMV